MSAKGKTWKKHKYIKKENGHYIYPEDVKDEDKVEEIEDDEEDDKEDLIEYLIRINNEAKERNKKINESIKEDYENGFGLKKLFDKFYDETKLGQFLTTPISELLKNLKHDGFSNDEIADFIALYEDEYLYHSAKGSSWKNHKYIKKIGEGASAIYKYAKDKTEDIKESIKEKETKDEIKEKKRKEEVVSKKQSDSEEEIFTNKEIKSKISNDLKEVQKIGNIWSNVFDEYGVIETMVGGPNKNYNEITEYNKYTKLDQSTKSNLRAEKKKYDDEIDNLKKITEELEDMLRGVKNKDNTKTDSDINKKYQEFLQAKNDLEKAYKDSKTLNRIINKLKHDGLEDDYLSHHGIEGQKWGKQNGPPYPLSRGQLSSAEEKKGGVSKSAKEKYGDSQNKKKTKNEVAKAKKDEKEPKEPPKATITKSEAAQHPTRLASAQDVYANRAMYTNQELQAYINRVQLENNIANLARQEYEASHPVKTFIKKKANQTLDNVINNATNAGMNYVKNALNEAMNGNKDHSGPSIEEIYRNPGKYSTKDMQDALNRQNNLDRISKKVNESSSKSESSNNDYVYKEVKQNNYTRPESKLKYYYKG